MYGSKISIQRFLKGLLDSLEQFAKFMKDAILFVLHFKDCCVLQEQSCVWVEEIALSDQVIVPVSSSL